MDLKNVKTPSNPVSQLILEINRETGGVFRKFVNGMDLITATKGDAVEVITFLREEMKECIAEPDGWGEKVKELGLDGQVSLVNDGQKSPIPFLRLTKEHKAILKIICPDVDDVKKYDKAPIPMNALAMLGLATQEGYFKKVEVWHSEGNPDPVMVGDGEFLLAQW